VEGHSGKPIQVGPLLYRIVDMALPDKEFYRGSSGVQSALLGPARLYATIHFSGFSGPIPTGNAQICRKLNPLCA